MDMQLINKYNKVFRFLLCAIDIFSKYARVVPLKDKNGITITNAFQKFFDGYNRKPNKIWIDKGSEFYNRSMKSWFQDNGIEMHSSHNEWKFIVAERFIRNLKNKRYKYMASISKNGHIDKLDDIVNEYNNIYHSTIKRWPDGAKSRKYFDFNAKNNDKDFKLEVGDHVRI